MRGFGKASSQGGRQVGLELEGKKMRHGKGVSSQGLGNVLVCWVPRVVFNRLHRGHSRNHRLP